MKKTLCALLAAGLLAGCGGSDEEEPTAQSTPAKTEAPAEKQDPAAAEAEIRETFDDYNKALAERDFDAACDGLSPETTAKLRENVKKLGVTAPPDDCGELLGKVYETIDKDPAQKKLIDEIAKSAEIDKITVTGDTAKIDWSAMANGQKTPISQTARRIDGEWKLVDVTN
jgi:hypothetical protein